MQMEQRRCSSEVEYLPSTCEVLDSIPSSTKYKHKNKKIDLGQGCSSVVDHLPSMCEAPWV
jgi:hypothetical protein